VQLITLEMHGKSNRGVLVSDKKRSPFALMSSRSDEVTRLLRDWSSGNAGALNQLAPLVYEELRRIAANFLHSERPGHTLQATALVHEAYIRLVEQDQPEWHSRAHFTAVAAHYMRQILVDHARKRSAAKRGGGGHVMSLDDVVVYAPDRSESLLALDDALQELAAAAPDKCRMVEMHFFGGMTHDEIATVLSLHSNTVARHLKVAQAWLQSRLTEPDKEL
jgi:RNA polymerase sigma factor (TIGR02999 family)